jgi:L-rhamnose isomerase
MTREEKYKLLLFQVIRNDILPNYTQVLELEKAKKTANQVAIATISKFPKMIEFKKLKQDYDEALAAVKETYAKDGSVFIEFPEGGRIR